MTFKEILRVSVFKDLIVKYNNDKTSYD